MTPSPLHARVHQDATFGYDPWPNDATRPDPAAAEDTLLAAASAQQRVYTGADTIAGDIGLMPGGLNCYASYVDNFGGYPDIVARFGPHFAGLLLSITIFGNPARCADCEPGAMVANDLPHWLDNVAVTGGDLPWVYTSASNMSNCNAFIGGRRVVRWSAHYGFGPHVCGPGTCGYPQADWTQWTDTGPGGENFDRSIGFYLPQQAPPPPPPPPPEATMAITSYVTHDSRVGVAVELQSGEVKHIEQQNPSGVPGESADWWKKADGSYNWLSLGNPGK